MTAWPFDHRPYLMVPYLANGRSWQGWDCWGVIVEIYRRELGIHLALWDTVDAADAAATAAAMAREAVSWREVAERDAQPFDVILLLDNGRPNHSGVAMVPPLFLHCQRGVGTILSSWSDPKQRWHRRVFAFHRHPSRA